MHYLLADDNSIAVIMGLACEASPSSIPLLLMIIELIMLSPAVLSPAALLGSTQVGKKKNNNPYPTSL